MGDEIMVEEKKVCCIDCIVERFERKGRIIYRFRVPLVEPWDTSDDGKR